MTTKEKYFHGKEFVLSSKKFRAPWIELILSLLGIALIVLGIILSVGVLGVIGIPLLLVSLLAALMTLGLSLLSTKGQFIGLAVGSILTAFGLWYGLSKASDTEIFSPALLGYVGGAVILSTLLNILKRSRGTQG